MQLQDFTLDQMKRRSSVQHSRVVCGIIDISSFFRLWWYLTFKHVCVIMRDEMVAELKLLTLVTVNRYPKAKFDLFFQ